MIKNISSTDLEITMSGQSGPYHSGHVMWDGGAQKFKVMDGQGNSQDMYGAQAYITMGNDWQVIKNWVFKKQAEERELEQLCKEYPMLADARKEFEMLKQLVKDHK
jgi:hypothetical protein